MFFSTVPMPEQDELEVNGERLRYAIRVSPYRTSDQRGGIFTFRRELKRKHYQKLWLRRHCRRSGHLCPRQCAAKDEDQTDQEMAADGA